jgi:hypothetical protein
MDTAQKEEKVQSTSATTKTTPDDGDGDVDIKADTDRMKEDDKSADSVAPTATLGDETKIGTKVEKTEETSTIQLSATSSCSSALSLSLHDCLSLGEIELGLERRQSVRPNHKDDTDEKKADIYLSWRKEEYLRSVEEVRRLPYLLQLLSSTRPLASVQSFVASKSKSGGDSGKQISVGAADTSSSDDDDDYLDRIVDRLEDVAATYSVAGGIDVVTNHLAPSVAKNLSRLPPLLKTRIDPNDDDKNAKNNKDYSWGTEGLVAVARDPIAKRKRLKKDPLSGSNKKTKQEKDGVNPETPNSANGMEDVLGTTSDEDEIIVAMDIELDETTEDRRASFTRRDSMLVAAEDSQESTVIKTLSELASLVVTSLDHRSNHDVEGDDDQQQHSGAASGGRKFSSLLSLNTDDILSEKAASISTSGRLGAADVGGDTMEGSDLSSTIFAIMHNAPVLQSRHVANALCRASVPQAGILISRLGANCPASVPSLLLGCIEAYCMSIEHHHRDDNDGICSSNGSHSKINLSCPVVAAAKSAIAAIAKLSQNESRRVQNKLQSLGIMIDMQLKLALEEGKSISAGPKREIGIIPIACLLIEHLSFSATTNFETEGAGSTSSNTRTAIAGPLQERMNSDSTQTPGDTNIDYAHDKPLFEYATACSKGAEPSLLLHFALNPDLYMQTLDFFSQAMTLGASISPSLSGGMKESLGKWSLVLRAFALLLLVPVPRSTTSSDNDSCNSYKPCIESFSSLLGNLDCEDEKSTSNDFENRPKKSKIDTLVALVSSCGIMLLSRNLVIEDRQGNDEIGKSTQTVQIMQTIFKILQSTSDQSDMLRTSVEDQIRANVTWGVFKRVLYPLEMASNIQEAYANNSYHSKQRGLYKFCKTMHPALEDSKYPESEPNIFFDMHFRLHELRRELESPTELLVERTNRFLGYILKEEDEDKTLLLMQNVESAQYVVEATNFLVKQNSSEIPKVLPMHIDIAWSRIASNWKVLDMNPTDGCRYNFLLRLLYAFIFLDKSPLSPFAFDPRSSPIKESLFMIQKISSKSTRNYIFSEFQGLIRHHCPEFIRIRSEQHLGLRESPPFDTMDRKSILTALSSSIRTHLRENNTQLCGNTTEQLFLLAKARICDSDVYSAVTNAFLTSSHAPSPAYSYHILCRDPIVCLKFSLFIWKCRSLRRIALSVLENLLTANNTITLEKSRHNSTALELLVARDAIVVRCLLAVLHGGDSKNVLICSMTTSFIRWMIQSRSGLVALMVKQGLQERDLDWLIENVPETMNESRYLLQIFSEQNSLTAAERLVAADASIRIAIVHGQANEMEAGQLILTAVSQLVDSFYLILGPVGLLPVDALFTAESSTPITQISQKAAFRILKALTKLRGSRNHFRRDCSMVLQKLISLCKVELQGAVAGRRKQLIKELYDAAVKAEK